MMGLIPADVRLPRKEIQFISLQTQGKFERNYAAPQKQ